MLDSEKLYNIMDYSGNYYMIDENNQLVVAGSESKAGIFDFVDANSRVSGSKAKFYFMAEANNISKEEDSISDSVSNGILEGIKEYYAEDIEEVNPVVDLNGGLHKVNWKEYLLDFAYIVEGLGKYKTFIQYKESEENQKICDILHYIELCDTDEEERDLVSQLREYRERRRYYKDERIMLEAFQDSIGTKANKTKALSAIKTISKLDSRMYTPRQLDYLFENKPIKKSGEHVIVENEAVNEYLEKDEYQEEEVMELTRRATVFDGKENDWLGFAKKQAQFYKEASQYIINLKLDIEEIDETIADIMEVIDESNCNVTQGYKLLKQLKDIRAERKEKEKELECLYILTEHFDVEAMAEEREKNANEIAKLLGGSNGIVRLAQEQESMYA